MLKNNDKRQNGRRLTSGFTQAGVYARRNICGNLEVCRPPEPLWNPRLREAATTLAAMRGRHSVLTMQKIRVEKLKKKCYLCIWN